MQSCSGETFLGSADKSLCSPQRCISTSFFLPRILSGLHNYTHTHIHTRTFSALSSGITPCPYHMAYSYRHSRTKFFTRLHLVACCRTLLPARDVATLLLVIGDVLVGMSRMRPAERRARPRLYLHSLLVPRLPPVREIVVSRGGSDRMCILYPPCPPSLSLHYREPDKLTPSMAT